MFLDDNRFQYSILFPPEKLFDSGALDETFLLLMGDHGFRMDFSWGGTDQGKTEATMPALAVLAPQQFRDKYPDKAQELNFIKIYRQKAFAFLAIQSVINLIIFHRRTS